MISLVFISSLFVVLLPFHHRRHSYLHLLINWGLEEEDSVSQSCLTWYTNLVSALFGRRWRGWEKGEEDDSFAWSTIKIETKKYSLQLKRRRRKWKIIIKKKKSWISRRSCVCSSLLITSLHSYRFSVSSSHSSDRNIREDCSSHHLSIHWNKR